MGMASNKLIGENNAVQRAGDGWRVASDTFVPEAAIESR